MLKYGKEVGELKDKNILYFFIIRNNYEIEYKGW